MSRRELAEAVNAYLWDTTNGRYELDPHLVAKWERGAVRWPTAAYRAALRGVLGVPTDADLGFRSPGHRRVESAGITESMAAPGVAVQVPGEDVEGVLMTAADESAQFLAWAESTNVGDLTVEQMRAEVRRVAHSYLKAPTVPLFIRTKALRDRTFSLLSGHQAPRQTRELYAAAGWSLTVLAWMSVDLGQPDAAEDHARAAWLCAERADHDALRAWVRATQHTAAFWQNDYATAAGYAADGLNYTGTGTAELFLSSALPLDLARAGDAERANTALHRAQRCSETVRRADDELAGPFTCPADRRNQGSERMTRLVQVKAHLVLDELDGAEEALLPVLETTPQHRVRPLLHSVSEVSEMVADTHRACDPIALRMRGSIIDFHRETVIKELTA